MGVKIKSFANGLTFVQNISTEWINIITVQTFTQSVFNMPVTHYGESIFEDIGFLKKKN